MDDQHADLFPEHGPPHHHQVSWDDIWGTGTPRPAISGSNALVTRPAPDEARHLDPEGSTMPNPDHDPEEIPGPASVPQLDRRTLGSEEADMDPARWPQGISEELPADISVDLVPGGLDRLHLEDLALAQPVRVDAGEDSQRDGQDVDPPEPPHVRPAADSVDEPEPAPDEEAGPTGDGAEAFFDGSEEAPEAIDGPSFFRQLVDPFADQPEETFRQFLAAEEEHQTSGVPGSRGYALPEHWSFSRSNARKVRDPDGDPGAEPGSSGPPVGEQEPKRKRFGIGRRGDS